MTAIQSAYSGTIPPSGDTTGTKDGAAIAAASSPVTLGPGTYYIKAAIAAKSNWTLQGAGRNQTIINQVTTTAAGISGTSLNRVTIRDLTLQGPGSGSGVGLSLVASGVTPNTYLDMSDVLVLSFGSHGIFLDTPIVSTLKNVVSQQNAGDGFHLTSSGTVGTSCALISCFANANTGTFGYSFTNMQYSSLSGCACDNATTDGYQFSACHAITCVGCGCEQAGFNAFEWTGGSGNAAVGCWVLANNNFGYHATGSEANLTLTGCSENSPAGGAVAGIKTESGTTVIVHNPVLATAASYTSATLAWSAGAIAFGHLSFGGMTPGAAAGGQAGTSPPSPVVTTGTNDGAGNITFGTGTGPVAGNMVQVTFNTAWSIPGGGAPHIVLTAANSATQALGLYVSGQSPTGFAITAANAPAASQANTTYSVNFAVLG